MAHKMASSMVSREPPRRRLWEPQAALLAGILLGAVVGIPFAILGYRHSWAWGYAGVAIVAGGTVIGILTALILQWRRAGLRLRTVVISAVALYWVISSGTGPLREHLKRMTDYQWVAGFLTGQSAAVADSTSDAATADCRRQAGSTQAGNNRPARYLSGCLAGVQYQLAHPHAPMNPSQLPPGVRAPTVRIGSQ